MKDKGDVLCSQKRREDGRAVTWEGRVVLYIFPAKVIRVNEK